MLWLARSLAKARGETRPFIGFNAYVFMFLIDIVI